MAKGKAKKKKFESAQVLDQHWVAVEIEELKSVIEDLVSTDGQLDVLKKKVNAAYTSAIVAGTMIGVGISIMINLAIKIARLFSG